METIELAMLGSAKRVTLTKDDTIVLHGGGGREKIADRCDMIRQVSDRMSDRMSDRVSAACVTA
jgi:chaperonin GroEL